MPGLVVMNCQVCQRKKSTRAKMGVGLLVEAPEAFARVYSDDSQLYRCVKLLTINFKSQCRSHMKNKVKLRRSVALARFRQSPGGDFGDPPLSTFRLSRSGSIAPIINTLLVKENCIVRSVRFQAVLHF